MADFTDLWWLKPSPQMDHGGAITSGFYQGMAAAQQNKRMALELKQFALQQQLRADGLEIANRRVDAQIADYERQRQEAMDEDSDMDAISRAMPELQAGIQIPLNLKTYRGMQALSRFQESLARERSAERLSAEDQRLRREFEEKLTVLGRYSPEVFHGVNTEYQKTKTITPQLRSIVDNTYRTEAEPFESAPPPGMEVQSIRRNLPGGNYVIATRPKPVEEKRLKASDMSQSIAKLRAEIAKAEIAPDPLLGPDEQAANLNGMKAQLRVLESEQSTARGEKPATAPAPSSDRVRVISPDGKVGSVPRSQLDQALKAGYKQAP